jgi:hypothetical protein
MDTKLDTLRWFLFDKYPVAQPTSTCACHEAPWWEGLNVIGIVTKVDLLGFLVSIVGTAEDAQ